MSRPRRSLPAAALLTLGLVAACGGGPDYDAREGESEAEAEGECGEDTPLPPAPTPDEPRSDAVRTTCGEITEYCDPAGAPEPALACAAGPAPAPPAGPATATMTGFLDVFGNGPDADGVRIEVFDADALDAAAACARDAGRLGAGEFVDLAPLGTTTVELDWDHTMGDARLAGAACRACPFDETLGLPCDVPTADCAPACDVKADYCYHGECVTRLRWECRYAIHDLPTNRRLAVRTSGLEGFADETWSRMVQYGVYLRADRVDGEGRHEQEVNVLHNADYETIPRTVVGEPVPRGRGAVAGEVHDCDDVRVEGAQVAIAPEPRATTYFNGNPIDTLPSLSRRLLGTARDGIYAGLDLPPGPVRVVAAARVGGEPVQIGDRVATVFPDTVTVLSFGEREPEPPAVAPATDR